MWRTAVHGVVDAAGWNSITAESITSRGSCFVNRNSLCGASGVTAIRDHESGKFFAKTPWKTANKGGGRGGATLRAKGMRVPPVRLLFCMQWTKCFAIPRRRLQRPNYVCPSTPHTAPGSLLSRRRGSATAAWRLHRSGRDRASPAGLYPHSAAALCSAR